MVWRGLAVAVHAMPVLQQYVHLHVLGHMHDEMALYMVICIYRAVPLCTWPRYMQTYNGAEKAAMQT